MNTKALGNPTSKKKQNQGPLISNQNTLLAVLALMLTFFFGGYTIINSINYKMDAGDSRLNVKIDALDNRLSAKIDGLKDQMSEMQGDIKVLLDRSSRDNQKSEN